ncbi:pentapeptide repeat-containing protein [Terribacillus saccharophilus]|uniref:pentapeptide repeat-containing protein n=1 Tax=Terribacillus saccharophilus TaxID=361277 RepID=UPI0039824EAF
MSSQIDTLAAGEYRKSLQADCANCFGLCCTALHIVASSDFAINKPAGAPCPNLQSDFRCQIHSELRGKGFKGCTVFDCFGAGQQVSQITFNGQDWRGNTQTAEKMFSVFPVMIQLYEMLAYVIEALSYPVPKELHIELTYQLSELENLIKLDADNLQSLDIMELRMPINELLSKTSVHIRGTITNSMPGKRKLDYRGADWIGKNAKGKDLRAADFRGAYLIAADLKHADLRAVDFIGADLRDANLEGADLSTSMFLTQMQINSAKGNKQTQLPAYLVQPSHWAS